jgi:signal transduction histidine kinase
MQSQKEKEQALRSLLLSISHELRTPAQSGLDASQLLAARDSVAADDEALFLVQAIGASCRLLLGMVSNVLSMRNIESGELEMHPSAFDPRAAVHDLLQVCRLGCSTSDIVWTNADEPLPATVTVRVCCGGTCV